MASAKDISDIISNTIHRLDATRAGNNNDQYAISEEEIFAVFRHCQDSDYINSLASKLDLTGLAMGTAAPSSLQGRQVPVPNQDQSSLEFVSDIMDGEIPQPHSLYLCDGGPGAADATQCLLSELESATSLATSIFDKYTTAIQRVRAHLPSIASSLDEALALLNIVRTKMDNVKNIQVLATVAAKKRAAMEEVRKILGWVSLRHISQKTALTFAGLLMDAIKSFSDRGAWKRSIEYQQLDPLFQQCLNAFYKEPDEAPVDIADALPPAQDDDVSVPSDVEMMESPVGAAVALPPAQGGRRNRSDVESDEAPVDIAYALPRQEDYDLSAPSVELLESPPAQRGRRDPSNFINLIESPADAAAAPNAGDPKRRRLQRDKGTAPPAPARVSLEADDKRTKRLLETARKELFPLGTKLNEEQFQRCANKDFLLSIDELSFGSRVWLKTNVYTGYDEYVLCQVRGGGILRRNLREMHIVDGDLGVIHLQLCGIDVTRMWHFTV